jgi:hypothetical protein
MFSNILMFFHPFQSLLSIVILNDLNEYSRQEKFLNFKIIIFLLNYLILNTTL